MLSFIKRKFLPDSRLDSNEVPPDQQKPQRPVSGRYEAFKLDRNKESSSKIEKKISLSSIDEKQQTEKVNNTFKSLSIQQSKLSLDQKNCTHFIDSLLNLIDIINQQSVKKYPLLDTKTSILLPNSLVIENISKSTQPLNRSFKKCKSETTPAKLIEQCFTWLLNNITVKHISKDIANAITKLPIGQLNLLKFLFFYHSSPSLNKAISDCQKIFEWELLKELQTRALKHTLTAEILKGNHSIVFEDSKLTNALYDFLRDEMHSNDTVKILEEYDLCTNHKVETVEYNKETNSLDSHPEIQRSIISSDIKKLILEANIDPEIKNSIKEKIILKPDDIKPVIRHLKFTIKDNFLKFSANDIFWNSKQFYTLCLKSHLPAFAMNWDRCIETYETTK